MTAPALPSSTAPLLVRTAFDDDTAWASLVEAVATPSPDDGFLADVAIVDDATYLDLAADELRGLLPAGEYVDYFFVADALAMRDPGHPLLVVPVPQAETPFLDEPPREPFRVVVTSLWAVENNLSLANQDWDDFAGHCDPDGVFRAY